MAVLLLLYLFPLATSGSASSCSVADLGEGPGGLAPPPFFLRVKILRPEGPKILGALTLILGLKGRKIFRAPTLERNLDPPLVLVFNTRREPSAL